MNDLALGKFDILMGDIGITHERQDLVDFSVAFQQDDVIIFRKNSDNHSNLFSFLLPLSVDVWIYIFISLILGSILYMCKTFITLRNCLVTLALFLTIRIRKTDHLSTFYSLWFSVASLFGQGVEELPRYVLHVVIN